MLSPSVPDQPRMSPFEEAHMVKGILRTKPALKRHSDVPFLNHRYQITVSF
jgi:hypothetical protein